MPPKKAAAAPRQRAEKWNESHKARFRQLIAHGKINPKKSDTKYIEKIRDEYFKDRPKITLRNNWKTSTAEWRVGEAIRQANEARAAKKAAGEGEFFLG